MVEVSLWYGAFPLIRKASWNPTVYLNSLSNNPGQGKGLSSMEIHSPFDIGLCTSGILFQCMYSQVDGNYQWIIPTSTSGESLPLCGADAVMLVNWLGQSGSKKLSPKPSLRKRAATTVLCLHKLLPCLFVRMFNSLWATVNNKSCLILKYSLWVLTVLYTEVTCQRRIRIYTRHPRYSVEMYDFREQFLLWIAHWKSISPLATLWLFGVFLIHDLWK